MMEQQRDVVSRGSEGAGTSYSAGAAKPLLSVIIPAYNEAARLPRTLEATCVYLDARGTAYEVLVVDDGSTDDTAAVAKEWTNRPAQPESKLQVLRYEQNRGKGHAVRHGVLRASGERVLYMDADLATPIEEIEKLEAALADGTTQVAIGSRPLRQSELLVRQPWYREMLGRGFNQVVQALATPGIQDTQCGFKLLNGEAARHIFSRCQLDGFSFDVEALFLVRKLGYRIAEVPVRWAHQEGAAAFATKGAYLRHGIRMLAELRRIRRIHHDVRPVAGVAVSATAGVGSTNPSPPVV